MTSLRKCLVIEIGTACDFCLFDHLIDMIRQRSRVVLITSRRVPGNSSNRYTYKMPAAVLQKTSNAFMSHKEGLLYLLADLTSCPSQVRIGPAIQAQISKVFADHRIDYLVVHYGVYQMGFLQNMCLPPMIVVYFAPCFPSNFPVIFDDVLKRSDYSLSDDKAAHESWNTFYQRLSCVNRERHRGITPTLHACAWDENLTPTIVPMQKRLPYRYVGSLGRHVTYTPTAYANLQNLAFVTFGSFSHSVKRSFVDSICKVLGDNGYTVLLSKLRSKYATTHVGYIEYSNLVRECALVVFTGSLCLQTTCFRYKCPMVYAPQLAEQYFWARCYLRKAGVPFLRTSADVGRAVEAANTPRVMKHLHRVSRSIIESHVRNRWFALEDACVSHETLRNVILP